MEFVKSMDNLEYQNIGENGEKGVALHGGMGKHQRDKKEFGSSLVEADFAFTRDLSEANIIKYMDSLQSECKKLNMSKKEMLKWVSVFACYVRDIDKGKGERKLSYVVVEYIFKIDYKTSIFVLNSFIDHSDNSIPYGSWVDFVNLSIRIYNKPQYNLLYKYLISRISNQIYFDFQDKTSISNVSKWVPRYKTSKKKGIASIKNKIAKDIAKEVSQIFGNNENKYKFYRQTVSSLTKVTETLMCSDNWDLITPSHVPSKCLFKHRRAFRNLNLKNNEQRSENPKRVVCSQNFEEAAKKAVENPSENKLNGKNMQIHELVNAVFQNSGNSIIEAQYANIRNNLLEEGNIPPMIPLVDVSGSMMGVPIDVSIGLGILASSLVSEPFKDRVLLFETNPSWFDLSKYSSFEQKVKALKKAGWGGSTDIFKAFKQILDVAVTNQLKQDDLPNYFLILSDMQFNQTDNNCKSQSGYITFYEKMKQEFALAGFKIPHIIFWNLRGSIKSAPVETFHESVTTIAGFSQSLLKHFMSGKDMGEYTPWTSLKEILESKRYDEIRKYL